MMIAYKLTDENGRTMGGVQWGLGVTHHAAIEGLGPLCSGHWIHGYVDPLIAVFMNPNHANFKSPLLWEIEADGEMMDDLGMKFGAKTVTTVRQKSLPQMSDTQRIRASIYLARVALELTGIEIPDWQTWADLWLSGDDRTSASAASATWAASAAGAAWAAWAAMAARDAGAASAAWAARAASAASAARDAWDAWAAEFTSLLLTCLYAAMDEE